MKRQHPIRKMKRSLGRCDWDNQAELVIARHVKPLLVELESLTKHHGIGGCACYSCRLLAAWKEKL